MSGSCLTKRGPKKLDLVDRFYGILPKSLIKSDIRSIIPQDLTLGSDIIGIEET